MSPWTQVALLTRREFVQRVASRAFRVTISLLTVAILAVGPIVNLVAGGPAEARSQIGRRAPQVGARQPPPPGADGGGRGAGPGLHAHAAQAHQAADDAQPGKRPRAPGAQPALGQRLGRSISEGSGI